MADGDIPISPGLGVGLFFILLILFFTGLIYGLRRRSQNKLYSEALNTEPGLTRLEFRRRRKARFEEEYAHERRYEAEARMLRCDNRRRKKERRAEDRRVRASGGDGGDREVEQGVQLAVQHEPWARERLEPRSEMEIGGDGGDGFIADADGNVVPYNQAWREQRAAMMRESHRPTAHENVGGPWAQEVYAEMDIGLRRFSRSESSLAQVPEADVLVEIPQRTAPPTRRPVMEEPEGLPAYSSEVLPPYKYTVDQAP